MLNTETRQFTISLLRKTGMIKIADLILYYYSKINNRNANLKFKLENPTLKLPPDYMMYESFQVNYHSYYFDSYESAKHLVQQITPYKTLSNSTILDWGCGPGRMVRHLPEILGAKSSIYGCDYNKNSISWCVNNIENVNFYTNDLHPPLPFESEKFDFIYGISIFTHLSEEMHVKWLDELYRILAADGILYLTTHGHSFRKKLTKSERLIYDADAIVIRGKTVEGHRSFVAFQPPAWFKKQLNNFEILEVVEGELNNGRPQQDVWILKKA